jgi:hypothetical protein
MEESMEQVVQRVEAPLQMGSKFSDTISAAIL